MRHSLSIRRLTPADIPDIRALNALFSRAFGPSER
jgi:hypothetical protein